LVQARWVSHGHDCEDLERLQPQELELLDGAWSPDKRSQFRRTAGTADGPDAAAVDAWFWMGAVDSSGDAQLSSLRERVEPVITRLRRRRRRADAQPRDA
jgi:hypothetical protein